MGPPRPRAIASPLYVYMGHADMMLADDWSPLGRYFPEPGATVVYARDVVLTPEESVDEHGTVKVGVAKTGKVNE